MSNEQLKTDLQSLFDRFYYLIELAIISRKLSNIFILLCYVSILCNLLAIFNLIYLLSTVFCIVFISLYKHTLEMEYLILDLVTRYTKYKGKDDYYPYLNKAVGRSYRLIYGRIAFLIFIKPLFGKRVIVQEYP